MSEAFVEEDVDNEVDGRVKYDEHVGDGPQVELKAAAAPRLVRRHVPHHPVDEHLADDEYGDDDYENESDIVVMLLANTLHLYTRPAERLQRYDRANVQQHRIENRSRKDSCFFAFETVHHRDALNGKQMVV